jgi:hypothetical protein
MYILFLGKIYKIFFNSKRHLEFLKCNASLYFLLLVLECPDREVLHASQSSLDLKSFL